MKKIELRMSISMLISQFYYEKSALGEKARNRKWRWSGIKGILLREKGESAQIS